MPYPVLKLVVTHSRGGNAVIRLTWSMRQTEEMKSGIWKRLGWLVLVLGAILLILPSLPALPQGLVFSIFHIFWPVVFFAAGLSGQVRWVAFAAFVAVCLHYFPAGPQGMPRIAAICAGLMAVSFVLDAILDGPLNRLSRTRFAVFLAGKVGTNGNIMPFVIPVAVAFYWEHDLAGYAGGRPELLVFGALHYLVGALFRRQEYLLEGVSYRWFFKLLSAFIFSALLALAHYRFSVGNLSWVPPYSFRRGLYGFTYAYLGWRWCYGLTGWSRGKPPLAPSEAAGSAA